MDPFSGRENEEKMFDLIRTLEDGPGMEPEHRDGPQTSTEFDDDSHSGGPPQSGEVY